MNDIDELWDNFAVSGRVSDYLKYKQNEEQTLLCKAEKTIEEQTI